ncbi:MAG: PQQ-dependent sugar dehydrogenase [Firmicutes bacterium]|nr:PQQ-dependent sugar dehydrogenase [Bacillota bacterium]
MRRRAVWLTPLLGAGLLAWTRLAGAPAADPPAREATVIGERFLPTPPGVRVETWVSGLEVPWSLVFLPDGRALVSERRGRIRLIVDGQLRPEPWAMLEVRHRGEGGLMGLALHPRYPQEPYVYAMMTVTAGGAAQNRVVRLRDRRERGELDRVIIAGIPGSDVHNGGRIAFGPDGMLYVTTGDGSQGARAQDPGSLAGKVLRLEPDGSIPPDNPLVGRRGRPEVYTYGHRNPQGLAWHPRTGALLASEHGPTGERGWRGHDEINVLLPGANYGWPEVIGAPGDARFVDPLVYWEAGLPPAGMTFWSDDLFVASLRAGALVRLTLRHDDGRYAVTSIERWWASGPMEGTYGRLRDAVVGPDGALYVLTSNRDGRGRPRPGDDRILRITRP